MCFKENQPDETYYGYQVKQGVRLHRLKSRAFPNNGLAS